RFRTCLGYLRAQFLDLGSPYLMERVPAVIDLPSRALGPRRLQFQLPRGHGHVSPAIVLPWVGVLSYIVCLCGCDQAIWPGGMNSVLIRSDSGQTAEPENCIFRSAN